jgi:hypothetical protein
MSRFNDIAQIYDYKLSQLRDPQVWQNTLRLTSNFWRLNFCAAMLLTEQNPKSSLLSPASGAKVQHLRKVKLTPSSNLIL